MKSICVAAGVLLAFSSGCGESSPYMTQARMGLQTLDKAVEAYKSRTGTWPDSLQSLTEQQPDGSQAYVKSGDLVDPWGRPYQYDPGNRHPETEHPQLWSEGPKPGEPGSKIANWTTGSAAKVP
jgi:general secretion pathway protein G